MPLVIKLCARYFYCLVLFTLTVLIVSACATKKERLTEKQPRVDLSLLQTLPAENISYNDQVSPVLERRCVVCHGCYDAPCQLKLSSPEW